jgi:hypothetical protein
MKKNIIVTADFETITLPVLYSDEDFIARDADNALIFHIEQKVSKQKNENFLARNTFGFSDEFYRIYELDQQLSEKKDDEESTNSADSSEKKRQK